MASKDLSKAVPWEQRPDCREAKGQAKIWEGHSRQTEQQDKDPGAGTSPRFEV